MDRLPPLQQVVLPASAGRAAYLRLAYREAGNPERPALVMLHGIGSNASGYRCLFERLTNDFRLIAWDAPGYGGSDGFADELPTIQDYADALLGLLDALGIGRATVMGSSLGALFVTRLAAMHPERVRALVLSAPATGFGCRAAGLGDAHAQGRIADFDRLGAVGLANERAAKLVAADADADTLALAHELVASINREGYARAARALGSANIFLDAPRIEAPTLIMVGRLDRVTTLDECARPIHEAIRGSELHVLEGHAHLLKIETPKQVSDLLREFLIKHP